MLFPTENHAYQGMSVSWQATYCHSRLAAWLRISRHDLRPSGHHLTWHLVPLLPTTLVNTHTLSIEHQRLDNLLGVVSLSPSAGCNTRCMPGTSYVSALQSWSTRAACCLLDRIRPIRGSLRSHIIWLQANSQLCSQSALCRPVVQRPNEEFQSGRQSVESH